MWVFESAPPLSYFLDVLLLAYHLCVTLTLAVSLYMLANCLCVRPCLWLFPVTDLPTTACECMCFCFCSKIFPLQADLISLSTPLSLAFPFIGWINPSVRATVDFPLWVRANVYLSYPVASHGRQVSLLLVYVFIPGCWIMFMCQFLLFTSDYLSLTSGRIRRQPHHEQIRYVSRLVLPIWGWSWEGLSGRRES